MPTCFIGVFCTSYTLHFTIRYDNSEQVRDSCPIRQDDMSPSGNTCPGIARRSVNLKPEVWHFKLVIRQEGKVKQLAFLRVSHLGRSFG